MQLYYYLSFGSKRADTQTVEMNEEKPLEEFNKLS